MSIKLYRTTDRIPIKIGDAIFKVSPLTMEQKNEMQSFTTKESGVTIQDIFKKTKLLFKYSIKEVSGIEYATGGEYKLSFDDDGTLSDECVEEFLNMEEKAKLSTVLWSFIVAISDKAIGPDGKPLKGVEILPVIGGDSTKK